MLNKNSKQTPNSPSKSEPEIAVLDAEHDCLAAVWDFSPFRGPIRYAQHIHKLIASGASEWIVLGSLGDDDPIIKHPDIDLAVRLATHFVVVRNMHDELAHVAGLLANSGGRVVLIEHSPLTVLNVGRTEAK